MSLCERCGRPINAQSQQCDHCDAGSDGLDPQFESFDTLPNLRGPSDLNAAWEQEQSGPSTTLLFSPRQSTPMIQESSYTSIKTRGRSPLRYAISKDEEAALEPIFDQTMSEVSSDIFDSIDAPDDMTALEEYVSDLESFDGELPELTHAASFELSGETEVSLLPSVTLEAIESPLPDPIDDFSGSTLPRPPTLSAGASLLKKGPPPLSTSPNLTRGEVDSLLSREAPQHLLFQLGSIHGDASTQVVARERFSVRQTELLWESTSEGRFKIWSASGSLSSPQAAQGEEIWRVVKDSERLASTSLLRCQGWRFVIRPSTLHELDLQLRSNTQRGSLSQRDPRSMIVIYKLDADEQQLYGVFPLREGITQVGVGTGDIVLSPESHSPHVLFTLSSDSSGAQLHPQLTDLWRALLPHEEVTFGTLLVVRGQAFSLLHL